MAPCFAEGCEHDLLSASDSAGTVGGMATAKNKKVGLGKSSRGMLHGFPQKYRWTFDTLLFVEKSGVGHRSVPPLCETSDPYGEMEQSPAAFSTKGSSLLSEEFSVV